MTSIKPIMAINKTCSTAIGGMLFASMLVTGGNISTVRANCLQSEDTVAIQANSAEILKTYTIQNGITYSIYGYNTNEILDSGVESVIINDEKIYNLKKLDQIAKLQDDWNGNKAKAFENELILKVRSIITALKIQPEIFPTACDSIQIEYEKEDGAYLEIELNLEDTWDVFEIDDTGEEKYSSISAEVDAIIKVVDSFYG